MIETVFSLKDFTATSLASAQEFLSWGREIFAPLRRFPTGPFANRCRSDVKIIDLRYKGGAHFVRGNHPRIEGLWPQCSGLETGVSRNLVIRHVISNEKKVDNAKSESHPLQIAPYGGALSLE